jgi:phosphoribosyl 1,2-cyclic phosphate phosphodiesterase
LKITFLGTGTSQGVPVIACDCEVCKSADPKDNRLRTSIFIENEGDKIVIDAGPDFRQQMLRFNILDVDAIVFTHEHRDHTSGLDDIRAYNHKYDKDMPIYGDDRVLKQLKAEYHYIFSDNKYPGIPRVVPIHITNTPFMVGNTILTPIEVLHYKLPVFGFRIKNFTYITDAKTISDEEIEKIKGTEILVINALQHTAHISHFTFQEALDFAQKINAKQTYFTHISHRLGLHQEIESILPENINLAYDGLELYI